MAAKVRGVARNGHVMSHARGDALVAAGADVFLHRLVRLHPSNLDGAVETVPDAGTPARRCHRLSR
jgi:hypothetical protein